MIVIGNIGNDVTAIKRNDGTGQFYSFRVAENLGKGENRRPTWWSVTANISELDADMLTVGMTVRMLGRAEAHPFKRGDGTLGSELRMYAATVEPYEFPTPGKPGTPALEGQ